MRAISSALIVIAGVSLLVGSVKWYPELREQTLLDRGWKMEAIQTELQKQSLTELERRFAPQPDFAPKKIVEWHPAPLNPLFLRTGMILIVGGSVIWVCSIVGGFVMRVRSMKNKPDSD